MLKMLECTLVAVMLHSAELYATADRPLPVPERALDHGYLNDKVWSGSRLEMNFARTLP